MIDKKIIEGCKVFDRKSQKELYETFYPKMLKLCLLYSNNNNDAKDLVQEGFIKVFKKIKKYRYNSPFNSWINRVFINFIIDEIRKKKKYKIVSVDNMDSFIDGGVEEREILNLKAKEIILLVQKLPPMQKLIFNLYIFDNYSYKEISKKLKMKQNTIRINLHRAKLKMKKLYHEKNNKKFVY